jgi:transporter family protein
MSADDKNFDIEIVYLRSMQCVKLRQPRILRGMTWLFWAILSAVFAAATALLAKVGVAGIDSNLATAIRTSVVLVFTWAIAIGFEKHHALAEIGRRSWVFLVLSGICTGLSWLCYFRALQMGPASSVAPIDKLSVVLVVLGAWFFLSEQLTPLKIGGVFLIAIGAVMLAFA